MEFAIGCMTDFVGCRVQILHLYYFAVMYVVQGHMVVVDRFTVLLIKSILHDIVMNYTENAHFMLYELVGFKQIKSNSIW